MPTYDYRCTNCQHEFEEFQLITDDPVAFCPKCHGKPERIITGGAGFIFKGSGFYITDHRSEKYKAAATKDRTDSVSSSSSSSSTSSTKSSSKSDAKKSSDSKS